MLDLQCRSQGAAGSVVAMMRRHAQAQAKEWIAVDEPPVSKNTANQTTTFACFF